MPELRVPSFIIAGVQRCGTTSLSRYLSWHPQVLFSPKKEVHYFDRDDRYPDHEWYRDQFGLERLEERLKQEERVIFGEGTPMYAFREDCIERIYQYDPEIKLILILRDPVKRAISQYWMNARRIRDMQDGQQNAFASEMLPTFQKQADDLRRGISVDRSGFVARGYYHEQISRIYQYFPPEQLLIIRLGGF